MVRCRRTFWYHLDLSHSEYPRSAPLSQNLIIRKVEEEDKEALIIVESKSTPNLRYVPHVFAMFYGHERGEFSLAEMDGDVVACAKFTVLPDESAWVETLRVIPERQGLGIGKRLYRRFFEVAEQEGVHTMRMYTGLNNKVSKGLAETNGFRLEETFLGYSLALQGMGDDTASPAFAIIDDLDQATELLMPLASSWGDFMVMNRTFYKWSPELCAHLAGLGQVYHQPGTDNVAVLGARFMPEQALHIGLFAGDVTVCLDFAQAMARQQRVSQLSCLFPQRCAHITSALEARAFSPNRAPFIVMKYGP